MNLSSQIISMLPKGHPVNIRHWAGNEELTFQDNWRKGETIESGSVIALALEHFLPYKTVENAFGTEIKIITKGRINLGLINN